ncbi:hypothetical protein RFK95_15725 [Acinetobacter pittii]|uniref:Uncharacterized protein n=2 Tax=Acinetobacter pittii TaxID=48296 RepID=A0AB37TD71_ACIPI|nr:hypothetical protein [Acinetobacter pittii]MDR0067230.1 hypothetical protein [Acinetobacter sp. 11520]KQG01707.1 hypothetical protein APC29_03655 [Acinetobacter pittii]MBM0876638.1 hypothetical protein [Acinetobacter pittii]MCU4620107.1 hypothetical protein [Acinetobacter pittii]MDQ8857507.1 hypothetical protein [Acinetobacter pittii]
MTNLISAQEAFAALQKGKTVLCRPEGGMLDFSDLDQFPASVFGKPGFEFCIKIDVIELAGITFTKPLTVDELEIDKEVFVINPAGFIEKHVYQGVGYGIVTMVDGGFAQRDLDNARLQYEALCKLLGGNSIKDVPLKTVELEIENKQSKKRSKKEPQVKAEEPQVIEKTSDVIPVETQPAIVITEQTNVTTSEDLLAPETSDTDIKPNVNAQFEILLDAIRICQSEKEVENVCSGLEKEGFSPEQIKSIDDAKQNRLTELDAQEIDAVTSMPENFESLVQSIQNAHTPEEVNSVVRYTSKWTEEQRKPLLNEMHKRLSELNQTKQQDDGLSPLIVRLQYAPDLNTLEELEREIPSRHPDVHKTLWNMAKKRRGELNAVSIPSLDPDYLLGDGF